MQDLLAILHKVSLKFQEANSVVADVSLCIKTVVSRIQSLEKRYRKYFNFILFQFLKIFLNL